MPTAQKSLILQVPRPEADWQAWARAMLRFLTVKLDQLDRKQDLFMTGAGSPEGRVSAVVGTLWLRTDGASGTTLYIKESGSGASGWVGK